jgi:hypothetical protein
MLAAEARGADGPEDGSGLTAVSEVGSMMMNCEETALLPKGALVGKMRSSAAPGGSKGVVMERIVVSLSEMSETVMLLDAMGMPPNVAPICIVFVCVCVYIYIYIYIYIHIYIYAKYCSERKVGCGCQRVVQTRLPVGQSAEPKTNGRQSSMQTQLQVRKDRKTTNQDRTCGHRNTAVCDLGHSCREKNNSADAKHHARNKQRPWRHVTNLLGEREKPDRYSDARPHCRPGGHNTDDFRWHSKVGEFEGNAPVRPGVDGERSLYSARGESAHVHLRREHLQRGFLCC